MAGAYYNEIDPFAAQWLRNLIAAGHIAQGDVDERSIEDVRPDDVARYGQCHFFAGIGCWSLALRLAGWPDDRPVWTGSCPCQPFSDNGRRRGFDDCRHLWPAWVRLIRECRPGTIFGEQVASRAGLSWLDLVLDDLESAGYACGAVDLCAAGVGAPHLRQRLYFVADTPSSRRSQERQDVGRCAGGSSAKGLEQRPVSGSDGHLGNANRARPQERQGTPDKRRAVRIKGEAAAAAGVVGGFWRDADLIWCGDERYRAVEPGTFPLAHGVANRVGRLRATGNALVPQVAAEVIRAFMECRP